MAMHDSFLLNNLLFYSIVFRRIYDIKGTATNATIIKIGFMYSTTRKVLEEILFDIKYDWFNFKHTFECD